MTDDDQTVGMVCSPVELGHARVPGSQIVTAGCGHEVWASPVTLDMIADAVDMKTICIPCAFKDPEFSKALKTQNVTMTKKQREEVGNIVGHDVLTDFMERIHAKEIP